MKVLTAEVRLVPFRRRASILVHTSWIDRRSRAQTSFSASHISGSSRRLVRCPAMVTLPLTSVLLPEKLGGMSLFPMIPNDVSSAPARNAPSGALLERLPRYVLE